MLDNGIKSIFLYISAWSWHLIAVSFLIGSIIAAMLNKYSFMIALAVIMGISEYMALKRQREFIKLTWD